MVGAAERGRRVDCGLRGEPMIPVEEVENHAWYDGFLISGGRQQGVRTLQWVMITPGHGEFFAAGDEKEIGIKHYEEAEGWGGAKFEPNMRSTKP